MDHPYQNQKERFLRAYANVPLNARREIILVLDERPLTWDVAYLEVKNDTDKARPILKKLNALGLV